jgi:hypothetical protein
MKRRKNETLQSSDWRFYSEPETLARHLYSGEDVGFGARPFASIDTGIDDSRRQQQVIFCEPSALPREWFYEAIEGGELRAYSHATRTGVYDFDDGQAVTIQCAENWFSRNVNPVDGVRQFQRAQFLFRNEFGFDFLSSPTLTGLYAIESKLPYSLPAGESSSAWRQFLHNNTTQSRNEIWLPKTADSFYYYDRRFAYAADASLDLPCGSPVETSGEEARYIPYECAWYQVVFNVPEDWRHIGLLPVLGVDGWTWPRERKRGGFVSFVAEPELRLALSSGWPVEIQRKWLFEKARPLEKSVKLLVALNERAKLLGEEIEAGIYRRILLQAIGALYARSFQRESIVDEVELLERDDAAVLTAQSLDDGRYSLTDRATQRGGRFYQPEWAAYIWSRARARLNAAMLGLPFDSLLGCHVDAIYADREALTIADSGKVGQFRLKGRIENKELTLNTMMDLSRVKAFAEAAFVAAKGGE